MIEIVRTNSSHPDFIGLVKLLDADLAKRDGSDHAFYNQFNNIDSIRHAIVLYEDKIPISCGAMKEFEPGSMEIKRMYTVPAHRGKGMAASVLKELEKWATELSNSKTVLETGKKQQEAIELYSRNGYKKIPNYGQYAGIENSICFEKSLIATP